MQPLPPQKCCNREDGKEREREREREGKRKRRRCSEYAPLGSLWPQQKWNVMHAARMPSASWLRLAKTDPSTCHAESQSASFEPSSHPPASFDRQDMLQRWVEVDHHRAPEPQACLPELHHVCAAL